MKTTNLSVNRENQEVNVTFALPFILPEHSIEDGQTDPVDIIAAGRDMLIKALQSHQTACIENLLKYKDNIIFNDGATIVYEMPDNETGTFSTTIYTIMAAAIDELKHDSCFTFAMNKEMIKQTIKALCVHHPDDMLNSIQCDDLISALLDCLENDYDLDH